MKWRELSNQLYAEFVFNNFTEAWSFMNQVALVVEKMNHHPTWANSYNQVNIYLSTHDEGNTITEKDKVLAKEISNIYSKYVQ